MKVYHQSRHAGETLTLSAGRSDVIVLNSQLAFPANSCVACMTSALSTSIPGFDKRYACSEYCQDPSLVYTKAEGKACSSCVTNANVTNTWGCQNCMISTTHGGVVDIDARAACFSCVTSDTHSFEDFAWSCGMCASMMEVQSRDACFSCLSTNSNDHLDPSLCINHFPQIQGYPKPPTAAMTSPPPLPQQQPSASPYPPIYPQMAQSPFPAKLPPTPGGVFSPPLRLTPPPSSLLPPLPPQMLVSPYLPPSPQVVGLPPPIPPQLSPSPSLPALNTSPQSSPLRPLAPPPSQPQLLASPYPPSSPSPQPPNPSPKPPPPSPQPPSPSPAPPPPSP
ncbi:hypothetical protein CEUSTIGMA_g11374.t1, partial [Chlamydomonas eustigma]